MSKYFRITVDGRSYNVVVDELDQITESAVPPVNAAAPAPAVPPKPAPASVAPAVAPGANTPGANTIAAPVAGVVCSIDATIGGAVAVGDKVAVIEAMKMKTEVVAKIAGKVTNIAVHVDDAVATAQVLMTLG